MPTDRRSLNLVAAVLCGIGSLLTLLAAARRKGGRDGVATLSGLFGMIGSAAWAMSALDDTSDEPDLV